MKSGRFAPLARRARRFAAAALVWSALNAVHSAASGPATRSLERTNLLVYRDRQGVPRSVESKRDWLQRRADMPFDFAELLGALAPRVCFVSAPLGDTNFKWRSVDAMVEAAAPVFRLYRVPQNLRVAHPDCDHDFPDEMRAAAYRQLDEHLR